MKHFKQVEGTLRRVKFNDSKNQYYLPIDNYKDIWAVKDVDFDHVIVFKLFKPSQIKVERERKISYDVLEMSISAADMIPVSVFSQEIDNNKQTKGRVVSFESNYFKRIVL